MSNAIFEEGQKKMKQPNFLFGDKIELPQDYLFDGNYKWLRQARGWYMFLLKMERSYPLSYLQATSMPRRMNWHLTNLQDRVLLEGFGSSLAFSTRADKHVTSLLPGLLKKGYPIGETPKTTSTFLSYFAMVHGEFPCQDSQPLGWFTLRQKYDAPFWQPLFWRTSRIN